MTSMIDGYCPKCGNRWRDYEPGDRLRCPVYETRVTLVHEDEVPDGEEGSS